MAENKEIVISYATLFELLRREKDREELQKLHETFFDDVREYIHEKQRVISGATLTDFDEKNRVEKEIYNVRKILKELYEKREKKIVNMALDKSKIKTNIIDSSSMLKEEKELFDSLVTVLDENRQYVALRLFSSSATTTEPKPAIPPVQAHQKEAAIDKKIDKNETKLVRFLHAVPKFVGTELEEYGPFEEEDVANLPEEIAQLLIDKARAEEINQ